MIEECNQSLRSSPGVVSISSAWWGVRACPWWCKLWRNRTGGRTHTTTHFSGIVDCWRLHCRYMLVLIWKHVSASWLCSINSYFKQYYTIVGNLCFLYLNLSGVLEYLEFTLLTSILWSYYIPNNVTRWRVIVWLSMLVNWNTLKRRLTTLTEGHWLPCKCVWVCEVSLGFNSIPTNQHGCGITALF